CVACALRLLCAVIVVVWRPGGEPGVAAAVELGDGCGPAAEAGFAPRSVGADTGARLKLEVGVEVAAVAPAAAGCPAAPAACALARSRRRSASAASREPHRRFSAAVLDRSA